MDEVLLFRQKYPKPFGVIAPGLNTSLYTATLRCSRYLRPRLLHRRSGLLSSRDVNTSLYVIPVPSALNPLLRIYLDCTALLGELDTPVLDGQSLAVTY
ncbi:MAG: hypothetical protein HW386_887 [Gammaproteobacteria bacterium]|nr:hypothetical protein [Gammaproteobacteria bacterium]